jgi:hypothetical protein
VKPKIIKNGCLFKRAVPESEFEMLKLETIHQEMNNKQVQEVAHDLHFDYMLVGLDGAENDPARLRKCIVARFEMYARLGAVEYQSPTEEQLLATERLFQTKVETGQAWSQ